jgi:hypothetical protein
MFTHWIALCFKNQNGNNKLSFHPELYSINLPSRALLPANHFFSRETRMNRIDRGLTLSTLLMAGLKTTIEIPDKIRFAF